MDTDPRPSRPVDSYDDERTVHDEPDDEIPVPLDAPFDLPAVDALEQAQTVVLDDDRSE